MQISLAVILSVIAGFAFLVIVAACVSAAVSTKRERERQELLAAWAQQHRWTFIRNPRVNWLGRVPGHFRQGVTLSLSGVVADRPVTLAEYRHTEYEGSSGSEGGTKTVQRVLVTVVRLRQSLPWISVTPRGALSRIARVAVGVGDTDTGHPEFDRAFRIKTTHPDLIARWCTPELRAAHLNDDLPVWNVLGDQLICYRPGWIGSPEEIPAMARPALRIADLIQA